MEDQQQSVHLIPWAAKGTAPPAPPRAACCALAAPRPHSRHRPSTAPPSVAGPAGGKGRPPSPPAGLTAMIAQYLRAPLPNARRMVRASPPSTNPHTALPSGRGSAWSSSGWTHSQEMCSSCGGEGCFGARPGPRAQACGRRVATTWLAARPRGPPLPPTHTRVGPAAPRPPETHPCQQHGQVCQRAPAARRRLGRGVAP
jgi:hypothetical protein